MTTVMMGFSISLDGFIATPEREDGGLHDWLFAGDLPFTMIGNEFSADSQASIDVFREVVDAIGAIVVGHTAFGDGEEPFFEVPTFVLSHNPRSSSNPNVTWVSEGIERALALASAAAGAKQVCVFGGASTAQQYLAAGLVDELRLTVVPVLFGDGLRLFDPGTGLRKLELVDSISTPTVTHLHMRFT
jgi:dihydrofolate reductase